MACHPNSPFSCQQAYITLCACALLHCQAYFGPVALDVQLLPCHCMEGALHVAYLLHTLPRTFKCLLRMVAGSACDTPHTHTFSLCLCVCVSLCVSPLPPPLSFSLSHTHTPLLFPQVVGRPAFLDPEATRPLAINTTHGLAAASAGAGTGGQGRGARGYAAASKEFDVSVLAPQLKGQQQ